MDRLSIAQRIDIIKAFYENGNSFAATFRAVQKNGHPSQRTIAKTVEKFQRTGSVKDVLSPVHNRGARSAENIAAVMESVKQSPNLSIPQRAKQLGLSYGSIWRILHLDLNCHSVDVNVKKISRNHSSKSSKTKDCMPKKCRTEDIEESPSAEEDKKNDAFQSQEDWKYSKEIKTAIWT